MKNKFIFLSLVLVFSFTSFVSVNAEEVLIENILIRNEGEVIYDGAFTLPEAGTISINDSTGTPHDVNTQSVLGVLYALDLTNESFEINELTYFESYGSFYLKCLNGACDNWQYVVNGVTPYSGIDSTILSGGETIGLYFGQPHQVLLSETELTLGAMLTATAQNYNYLDNSWEPLTNVNIGVTVPNPEDEWNPIVISENPVSDDGIVEISFTEAGTYNLGIKEDYYFPIYSVVVKPKSNNSGGGSMVRPIEEVKIFDIEKAIDFLRLNQKEDGSFGEVLYTDWAGIAIASVGEMAKDLQVKLVEFFKKNEYDPKTITDAERHAMALMSLNINPYSDTKINYIQKIVDSFDGTQFGDKNIIADDIFALIILKNAGYAEEDEIIKKDVAYVIANQGEDGAWVGIDMTSAGVQALSQFIGLSGVEDAIVKAQSFILSKQEGGGSFENTSATSWAILSLLGNDDYKLSVQNAVNYLATKQQEDGGVELATESIENRIWATAYALPAITNKPWNIIMHKFDKQIYVAPISPTAQTQNLVTIKPVTKKLPTEVSTSKMADDKINANTNQSASAINALPKKNILQKFWHWLGNMF